MDRRFEFRIFGQELDALPKMFASEGKEIGNDTSISLYLVSRLNIEANVKIREGQLEVKTLEARQRQLELWRWPRISSTINCDLISKKRRAHAVSRPSGAPASDNTLSLNPARIRHWEQKRGL
jgi:hypothetical protein